MPIHDVSEYVHWNLPAPEFYIQHLLAKRGSMMLYGQAGARKSWMAQYIGFCIATGSEWLGFNTEQARVLLVNFEISPIAYAVLRLRPMEQRFQLQPMYLYEYSPGITPLEEDEPYSLFAQEVRAIHPQVLILDCLQGCYVSDENDMARASLWVRNVSRLQQELDMAIIVIHHSNKSIISTSLNRVRGTTRFTAWVDTVINIAEQPTGTQLQFEKYRLSMLPVLHNLNTQFQDYIWTVRR